MKKIFSILILVLVIIAAVTLLIKRKADLAKAPIASVLPVVVDSAHLSYGDVRLTLPAMGLVTSDISTTLSTRISGQILKVMKQEGDMVKKGETMVTIDAADLIAKENATMAREQAMNFKIAAAEEDVRAAETALAAAWATHARTLELLKVKGASIEQSSLEESEIANLRAKVTTAKNTVASLKKEKDALNQTLKEIRAMASYATITAPIDGTVSQAMARPGDLAIPGKPLFRIAAGSGLLVNLFLPDTIQAREIIIHDKTLPLAPKNEAAATGLAQYIAPLSSELGLTEGQYVNVSVVVYHGKNTLVPVDGILNVGDDAFVLTYIDGKAVKTKVNIVARGSEGVVVSPDLAGQTILLAKPDILLRAVAGAPIQLTTPTDVWMENKVKPAIPGGSQDV